MKLNRLAERIKNLRREGSWSQAQLAEVASLSIRTVQRVEIDGKCSHESMLALASAFDIDVKELTVLTIDKLNSNAKFSFSLHGYNVNFGWISSRTCFIVGLIMIFPAGYFISASILKYNFGVSFLFDPLEIFFSSYEMFKIFNLILPAIFLFGVLGAFVLNLLTMLSVKLWKEKNAFKSEVSFNPRTLNLMMSIISFSSLMILLAYVLTENFIVR